MSLYGRTLELVIKHIDASECWPINRVPWLPSYSASRFLGSLDHVSGACQVYYEPDWPRAFSIDSILSLLEESLGRIESPGERLDEAVRRTAFLHEWRHFHDCFCTPAGFAIFEDYVSLHVMLYVLVGDLIARGCRIGQPFFPLNPEA